jgi:hypothetical protein
MLAARDQENLAFSRQTVAAAKSHAQPSKTPGTRFPKTPLKVPLNDENATTVLGKTMLGNRTKLANENIQTAGKGKAVLATPLGMSTGPLTGVMQAGLELKLMMAHQCRATYGKSASGQQDDQRQGKDWPAPGREEHRARIREEPAAGHRLPST